MSHLATIKKQQEATRLKAMELLGWDELKYNTTIYEAGEAYLEEHIGHDVWGVDLLLRSAEFWNWFKNHWHTRELDFIAEAPSMKPAERVLWHGLTHNVNSMERSMHHSYAQTIIKLAKKQAA